MASPFDFVKDLSFEKKNIWSDNKEEYVPFLINRSFSYFIDTILLAEEMDRASGIDKKAQHDFYFYAIRPKKRFSKWAKTNVSEDIMLVSETYKYSIEKSKQMISLLSEEQLQYLRDINNIGGVKTKNERK